MKVAYEFSDLLGIMARLRGENGCPWDKAQTHESILNCLVEESAEFIDAVLAGDNINMREELGDILLQVVFHSQMARESGTFSIQNVIQEVSEKLVRRHPHVFGEDFADSADEVIHIWDKIKNKEKSRNDKKEKKSALEGVPRNFEPLLKAEKIQKKAAKVGFDWPSSKGPLNKIQEEMGELNRVMPGGSNPSKKEAEAELGDLLFSVVNLSRHLGINPAIALEKSNRKFVTRFQHMEQTCKEKGINLKGKSLNELDVYWEKAKVALAQNEVIDDKSHTKNK